MTRNAKVVVAMSGGVDSSVAAALLKEQGHDVYGITMKLSNWQDTEKRKFGGCCGSKDFYDARSVAQALGIPHYSLDYVDHFKTTVIDYFKDSYKNAETPNPCIACNNYVKFDRLLQQAMAMGADYLATGHYARIMTAQSEQRAASSYQLRKAVDPSKDQSYVLYHLGQKELSRLMFPLGDYTKPQIRELARKYGLKTADKPDSYEICFVPNLDYKQFVSEEISERDRPEGVIRHVDGRVLGKHRGLPYYTVGQREGLGLSVGHPLYVVALDKVTNTVIVGGKDDVLSRTAIIRQVTWALGEPPSFPARVKVKIRSKHQEAAAVLQTRDLETQRRGRDTDIASSPVTQSLVDVVFDVPQSAVTPGQTAVFYDGDAVLGGGVIDRVEHEAYAKV